MNRQQIIEMNPVVVKVMKTAKTVVVVVEEAVEDCVEVMED